MVRKKVSGIMSILLVLSMLSLLSYIQPVKASGTIYIRADGSVDPPTAPIYTADNITYTLTGNITADANGIVIERDNTVLDGSGYAVMGSGGGNGITLSGRSNVTIKNMEITTFSDGILLESSSNISICGNNITANTGEPGGIRFFSSSGNSICGNNITANNGFGITLFSSNYNSVSGNNITASTYDGIWLGYSSSYNSVIGNNITDDRTGITINHSSNYNTISGNYMTANNGDGIANWACSNNIISGNNITANIYDGIMLYVLDYPSNYNSIYGNSITANNRYGIYLYGSLSNSISGNDVANNNLGIYLDSSSSSAIYHNNFINNTVQVVSANSANVWDNGYPSGGNYWSDYSGNDTSSGPYQNEPGSDKIGDTPYVIDANNVDHYPLMYLWVPPPKFVPLLDTFVTIMKASTLGWDTTIETPFVIYDAGLYKMWYGAWASGRSAIAYAESNDGITWFNNQVVHDAGYSYYCTGIPYVLKEGGTYRMWHGDYWEWIDGDWSWYIAHMTSTDGINWPAFMSAGDQKVLSAQGQRNPQGDGYDITSACVIHESSGYVMWYTVTDHYQPGATGPSKIWRATSTDGITWSNRQLSLPYIPDTWEGSFGHASVVKEDDGTYTMFYGAAYSNGTNSGIGMAQSSDGISWVNRTQLLKPSDLGANITYIGNPSEFTDVNGNRYLYFAIYDGESKFGRIQLGPLPHDLAITGITPSKTVVVQGDSIKINVTAANLGNNAETFNVTAYANATNIGSENVTLSAGNFATVTFTWNTSDFVYGNYTLSAYAWPVPGETNTADNNFTDGVLKVTIPGDVDGNFKVDMGDISSLCDGFGSTIGTDGNYWHKPPGILDPFSPNFDIDGNGKIDMGDIVTALDNFGQHYP